MTGRVPDGPAGAVAPCVHGAPPASYLNLTKRSGPLHNRRDTVSPADKVRLSPVRQGPSPTGLERLWWYRLLSGACLPNRRMP
jgi:hypothetical protein